MSTKVRENVVGVHTHTHTHTHTHGQSRNELDKAFCAQKPNIIFSNIKLVM